MSIETNPAVANEVESNVSTSNQEASQSMSVSQPFNNEMKNVIYCMMSQWFNEFMRANLAAPQPPPSIFPSPAPLYPQNPTPAIVHQPLVDKICKCGAEEFRGKDYDDGQS